MIAEEWLNSIQQRIQSGSLLPASYFANLDCDAALDSRDGDYEFDANWVRWHEEVERLWASALINEHLRTMVEQIRQESFLAVSNATKQHEIASYVSDDFDLIVRARLLGVKNPFLEQLWRTYDGARFPFPEQEK